MCDCAQSDREGLIILAIAKRENVDSRDVTQSR